VLERNGWIVPTEREKEGRRPERTIYRLAKSGREVLVGVVSDILARPRREYPHFAAGLMFMHHLSASEAAEHLRNRTLALKVTTENVAILAMHTGLNTTLDQNFWVLNAYVLV